MATAGVGVACWRAGVWTEDRAAGGLARLTSEQAAKLKARAAVASHEIERVVTVENIIKPRNLYVAPDAASGLFYAGPTGAKFPAA